MKSNTLLAAATLLAATASAQTSTGDNSATSSGAAWDNGAGPSAVSGQSTGSSSANPVADYFRNWFTRVSQTQAEQPHWVTPLVTVTPRLEEELRYDQMWESDHDDHSLTSFGGGKGLELIPAEPIEIIIGIPAWQTQFSSPQHKDGWTDESFLIKYRLLSANEQEGDYILTAFMGLSVPNGSDNTTGHHYLYTPTLAGGKGWGDFDIQSTLGVTIPDNGSVKTGSGTPIVSNTALQYHVMKYFWPEVEANFTYWPNGEHSELSQLYITPGLLIGRIHIAGRLGLTAGIGYQVAVTDEHPNYRNNLVLSLRLPF
ncbi:MAG: hypothetical protein ABSH48_20830 [Verrucomicrobiota bacterium]